MLPTPDLSHLTPKDYDDVYEPAGTKQPQLLPPSYVRLTKGISPPEDTFLLLDALETDAESLKDLHPSVCLEVGSGSGCVTSFIGKILGPSVLYLCTDINPHACRCTRLTGAQNQVDIQVVNGSLDEPFQTRLAHKIDVILFNPPYVPTSEEEASIAQHSRDIGGAWAGGSDGMLITNVLLQRIEALLSPTGRFYLVALKQNNIPKIIQTILELYGLSGEIVLQRRAGREHLFIIRFIRQNTLNQ